VVITWNILSNLHSARVCSCDALCFLGGADRNFKLGEFHTSVTALDASNRDWSRSKLTENKV